MSRSEIDMKRISIVIPCYRSAETLPHVLGEIAAEFRQQNTFDYEIILVSDASPDSVYDVICEYAMKDSHIKGVEMARNFGQHAALMAGYRLVTGDIVVSMDDDGEIPTSGMFQLIKKLEEGYDVAYASYNNIVRGLFRAFGTVLNDWMSNILLEKQKDIKISSFFAAKRFVINDVIRYTASYPYIPGLVMRTTKKIANVEMTLRNRLAGSSGYTFKKLLSLWLNGFTAFSVKPLRIASLVGVVCTGVGVLYGLYIIIHRLLNPSIPAGYSSMMAVLLFIGGMIMLMLGMIGEYVGRIYISINNSPQYVIRQTINLGEENHQQGKAEERTDCE